MILQLLLLSLGIALLVGGGDLLVRGASGIASNLGVSPVVVGLTVVAFGTSAPELVVNLVAAFNDQGELSFGNIFGSNLANIGLILGVTALIRPLEIHSRMIRREIPIMVVITLIAVAMGFQGISTHVGTYGRTDGIILLAILGVFLYATIREVVVGRGDPLMQQAAEYPRPEARKPALNLAFTLGGLVALVAGGSLTVDAASDVARGFGVPEAIIGLSLVAVGTSLPELVTSIIATAKGETDLAIGNVVGSNIFNLGLILGLTATISPTPVPVPAGGVLDLMVLSLLSAALLIATPTHHQRIVRWEGLLFLASWAAYTGWRVLQG